MKKPKRLPWPPPYRIKENARAKRVTLRILPESGLVLTVPRGFDRHRLGPILDEYRSWIEGRLAQVQEKRLVLTRPEVLPDRIHLPAVDTTWQVDYAPGEPGKVEIFWNHRPEPRIRCRGDFSQVSICCRLLREWLKEEAKRVLRPWVEALSHETGLSYCKVRIATQKTRWGSYSSRGTVSLNAAVLFLPRNLARLIICHELCHSRHPGHDDAFWDLLTRLEPDCRRLDAELKDWGSRMPAWYRASFL
ncbi:hypothetical protein SAMN02746041_01260 [Desulfacinum hydrothermale DSM 13146]|uniref:YgjP-like metallopeptidase domain-containing protein n=1 Tax=Desulfacinum hydrothermale DSM 13146 TaxID=1121390 RepID=A0A1W1XCS4_9BACT|nr:YgjP-like metallopeptidase domain-containing protein [Desulfacinum hydrothermale]SMC21693.1 hypothetical protein SAMN02746041_01260 [Desulfacinum hydrothermale DSM 13146]